MGKNNNKPVRLPPPTDTNADFEEKPFHSKQYEQEYLDSLLNAPERLTWDEFKEQQRKKGEMESSHARAEEEAQREFRKQLDQERAAKLTRGKAGVGSAADAEGGRKEKRKKEKHKKEKHKKKKRRHNDSDSDDSAEGRRSSKKEKRSKAEAPVSLSSFFNAASDSDS